MTANHNNTWTFRLLFTFCLHQAGNDFKRLFTISEFKDWDRSAFYWAIQSVRKNGMDMTGWLQYLVEGLSSQRAEVRERREQVMHRVQCNLDKE